jgi:hypothetical protein
MATTDREKEREAELEGAMYTNCLLLGLDPAVLGSPTSPRVGLFRHSNPRLGEQLLYFLLSSLRGPAQSAKARSLFLLSLMLPFLPRVWGRFRVSLTCGLVWFSLMQDFDKVWPIFDSAQSREFRKVRRCTSFHFLFQL